MSMQVFVEGDFPTGKQCKYHCCPSCHPAQIGPETVYGCTSKAWTINREGDFCPIVQCGGNPDKCTLKDKRFNKMIGNYKSGLTRSLNTATEKVKRLKKELGELKELLNK